MHNFKEGYQEIIEVAILEVFVASIITNVSEYKWMRKYISSNNQAIVLSDLGSIAIIAAAGMEAIRIRV